MAFALLLPAGVLPDHRQCSAQKTHRRTHALNVVPFGGLRTVRCTPAALRTESQNPSFQQVARQATGTGSRGHRQITRALNIVFVSAEVAPWSKTGGLGDVVGGLPVELAKRGHKVLSIAPR